MTQLFDTMFSFFETDEWPFTRLENQNSLRMGFKGENGEWLCYAFTREDRHLFIFYSVCPILTPANKRQAIAEFLTRANYDLPVGNFEMDFDDGEIRFKTSIDTEDSDLTPALVKNLVYGNVFTMDRYLPGMMKVIYADVPPLEAIKKIEGEAGTLPPALDESGPAGEETRVEEETL